MLKSPESAREEGGRPAGSAVCNVRVEGRVQSVPSEELSRAHTLTLGTVDKATGRLAVFTHWLTAEDCQPLRALLTSTLHNETRDRQSSLGRRKALLGGSSGKQSPGEAHLKEAACLRYSSVQVKT